MKQSKKERRQKRKSRMVGWKLKGKSFAKWKVNTYSIQNACCYTSCKTDVSSELVKSIIQCVSYLQTTNLKAEENTRDDDDRRPFARGTSCLHYEHRKAYGNDHKGDSEGNDKHYEAKGVELPVEIQTKVSIEVYDEDQSHKTCFFLVESIM